jgi:hypothetical protein
MKIKKGKLLRIILILLLLFILAFQVAKTKEFFNKKELLQNEIEKQQQQNINLKNKYLKTVYNNKAKETETKTRLKENTAEILTDLKNYNLKLVDFSSAQTELNLNLNGDFYSILNFIHYLEIEKNQFKIEEFKIKNNDSNLFFFLKLKNELIKNEKDIF